MSRIVDSALGAEVFIDRRVSPGRWTRTDFVVNGTAIGASSQHEDLLIRQARIAGLSWPYSVDIEIKVKSLDQLDDEDIQRTLVLMVMKAAGINLMKGTK